ncbi:hypothetical protein [Janthinobacterium psychrotolerans]|nr:hypothetical protein [Janthinobacterium psychrotolerans]
MAADSAVNVYSSKQYWKSMVFADQALVASGSAWQSMATWLRRFDSNAA